MRKQVLWFHLPSPEHTNHWVQKTSTFFNIFYAVKMSHLTFSIKASKEFVSSLMWQSTFLFTNTFCCFILVLYNQRKRKQRKGFTSYLHWLLLTHISNYVNGWKLVFITNTIKTLSFLGLISLVTLYKLAVDAVLLWNF